jgi:CBS domain-containing protein
VSEIMTKNPITVNYDSSILEVTRLMSENGFRRLIVVKNKKVVGIVTAKDVIEVLSA